MSQCVIPVLRNNSNMDPKELVFQFDMYYSLFPADKYTTCPLETVTLNTQTAKTFLLMSLTLRNDR